MLAILTPLFDHRTASYAARLSSAPRDYTAAYPLIALLDDEHMLDEAMQRYSKRWGCDDMRAVASAWSLDYFAALLMPVMAALALLRHQLPLAPEQVRVQFADDGSTARICLPDSGRAWPEAHPGERYEVLVWQHLAPLVATLNRRFKTPSRILWGNALRRMHAVLQRGAPLLSASDQVQLQQDRHVLFDHQLWPDGRVNPLFHRHAGVAPGNGYCHRNCCLYYRLPGEDYCSACPLHPDRKKETPNKDSAAPAN